MDGQFSLFGSIAPEKKRSPGEYAFDRYIGQLVRDSHGVHKIAGIEEYYTIYDDNTCGTPHDMCPVEEKEFAEYLEKEIEYEQHKIDTYKGYDGMRSIYENNLKILLEEKRKLQDSMKDNSDYDHDELELE